MMKKISVVIPVYRAADTLRRCVESIVYGAEKDLEIILVEDCSDDSSWPLCQSLAAEYDNVICLQNEKNSGVSFTRNQGLAIAQGEYILFVDSDDWVSGNYAYELLQTAEAHPDAMALCGFRFYDRVEGYERDYLWNDCRNREETADQTRFFDLYEKVLLQQLWNKIFQRSVIEKAHIRFDETQSMGEDFQFVLDYMEAAGIQQCVVRDAAFYHYIRANSHSLMSKFAINEVRKSFARFERLRRLCADTEQSHRQYEQHVEKLKSNFVYHISRSNKLDKQEKLEKIEQVMEDGQARRHLQQQRTVFVKESVLAMAQKATRLPKRIRGRVQRDHMQRWLKKQRKMLHRKDVSIISQNCIGGVFSHDMGLQFLSPTVNLYFCAEDFVKFASDIARYLPQTPQMHWGETYPIGVIEDISIHFMHFDSCKEAKESWLKRCRRVDPEKIVILSTDRNGFTEEVFQKWTEIPYPKVLFTANPAFAQQPGSIYYPQYRSQGCVPDLIPKREFYKDDVLMTTVNQL